MNLKGKCAIAGVGITAMGKIYGRSVTGFATEAIDLALENAGLTIDDLDGLLINAGLDTGLNLSLQNTMGLRDLRLLNHMNAFGSTAAAMVQFASLAIEAGMARTVACVFADTPLKEGSSAGAAYGGRGIANVPGGYASLLHAHGYFGANTGYAFAARRHMELYGTTSEQFGEIAVSSRAWAVMNERAQMREPITVEDHQNSRFIVEPLHLLDCCLVSNGGVAVIVTSAQQARDLRQQPAYILGMGQGHPGDALRAGREPMVETGARMAGETAFRMAGIGPEDIQACEMYDCYTYTVLVTLEDYGFCKKGEGGAFVEQGRLGPGGDLPVNTGGGQLSSYYMWGMTPLSEAVLQMQGNAGERQLPNLRYMLVTGNGGILSYHGCVILGSEPS
ncbi:MAG: thiolase family protein [SAR324 cluster bacterium]|nr:thiolase family protein [SAR324 cluster bacterium]